MPRGERDASLRRGLPVSNVPDPRVVDSVRARLRNVAARENYEGVRIELLALLERTRIHI
jgi:hypothetical protein